MMKLTEKQLDMLSQVCLRPHGLLVRDDEDKAIILELAAKTLVCDPHDMGASLFTRITTAGRTALREGETT